MDWRLEELEGQVALRRAELDALYATDAPEEDKEAAWGNLEVAGLRRDVGRLLWLQQLEADRWRSSIARHLAPVLRDIGRRLLAIARRPEIARLIGDLKALGEHAKKPRPAFWRALGGARRSPGAGPIRRFGFALAMPPNRRPWQPAFMRQKE